MLLPRACGRTFAFSSHRAVASRCSSGRARHIHSQTRRPSRLRRSAALPVSLFGFIRTMASGEGIKVDQQEQWWPEGAVAIVTGANKGIGKSIAQIMAQNGLKTVVAARDESRGQKAVQELQQKTGSSNIFFEQLDLSDPKSVEQFATSVKEKYNNVTILINNAGLAFKGSIFGPEEARQTLDVNFTGTKNVCEAILPLIPNGGRLVNVGSMSGKQRIIKSPELLQRFNDSKDAKDLEVLADEFVDAVKKATTSGGGMTGGWPGSMYGVSKLCEMTYTKKLADRYQGRVDINACCPGSVRTDMSSQRGSKTEIEGADTPAWLALLAPRGTTGRFFSDRTEESF